MTISRTPLGVDRAGELAARCLSDSMHAARVSDDALAEALCVSATLVRAIRRGEKPLTAARILQLPTALRADVLRRLAATSEPCPCTSRETQARVLSLATGRLVVALATVELDGQVTEAEVRETVAPALAAVDRAAEPFRAPVLTERAS